MRELVTKEWSGDIPGYGAVSRAGWAISIPNAQRIVCSFRAALEGLPEPANWVEISDEGQLAWQGHDTDLIYRGPTATGVKGFGQHAFVFVDETLRILTTKEEYQATEGGWAYVDEAGQIVPLGRVQSGPPLWERTEFHDVAIGQGPNNSDGVCIHVPGEAFIRQLEAGDYFHIRAARLGDTFLILAVNRPRHYTRVWEVTLAELRSLPRLGATTPEQPPPPEPHPMPVPNESAFVAAFLAPRLKNLGSEGATRANSFEAVNACCVALRSKGDPNFGLLEKTTGDNVRSRAADVLLYAISTTEAQVIDVVNDAEGNPSPAWALKDIRPIGQWRQPYPLSPNDPPPQPTPTIDAAVQALIEAAVAPLRADIAALKAQKPPAPQPISLTGKRVALRTANGHYVCAEGGGGGDLNATREAIGDWETLTLEER